MSIKIYAKSRFILHHAPVLFKMLNIHETGEIGEKLKHFLLKCPIFMGESCESHAKLVRVGKSGQ